MGLSSLLSVSPAVRLATDQPRRYATRKGYGLPRFGTAPQKAMQKQTMNADAHQEPNRREAQTASRAQTAAAPSPLRPAGLSPRQAPRWWNLKAWFIDRWFGSKNHFAPPARGGARALVQQELSLEHVKPRRNDLSDAGWELAPPTAGRRRSAVLKQRGTATGRASAVGEESRREMAGQRI